VVFGHGAMSDSGPLCALEQTWKPIRIGHRGLSVSPSEKVPAQVRGGNETGELHPSKTSLAVGVVLTFMHDHPLRACRRGRHSMNPSEFSGDSSGECRLAATTLRDAGWPEKGIKPVQLSFRIAKLKLVRWGTTKEHEPSLGDVPHRTRGDRQPGGGLPFSRSRHCPTADGRACRETSHGNAANPLAVASIRITVPPA
jgi:hypothetical protein